LIEQTKLAFDFIQKLFLEVSYMIKEAEAIYREEPEEFVVTGSTEKVIETSSLSANPSSEQMIRGMDMATLRGYIRGQGGEWNKHWSRERLIKEALTLQ